ncbi:hypothetical protein [Ferrovibrio sp.]
MRALAGAVAGRRAEDAGTDPVAARYEAARPFWVAERRLRDR